MSQSDQISVSKLITLRRDIMKPLYQQMAEQLSALIRNGQIPSGAILPPERQLAELLGVSRGTVQQCYGHLRDQELIHGHGRHGSIVSRGRERLVPEKERLRGFSEEVEALGQTPSTRVLEREIVCDRSIASLFGLPSETRFLKLVRLRFADEVPISVESAWYSLHAAPELADADGQSSIYKRLTDVGRPLEYCDQTIDAVSPSKEEVELFGFSAPQPCLLIKRRSYIGGGQMIEYVEGVFRGDAYTYRMRLAA